METIKYTIYKLIDPNTNEIRYIGLTFNDLKQRLRSHCGDKSKTHKSNWIQSLRNRGFSPIIESIEENISTFDEACEREIYYIDYFKSSIPEYGYNLAKVNEFRRNTYNNEVKKKLSKYNLQKNSNFNSFHLQNISSNEIKTFDNLVDAANYLIDNGFATGNPRNVRMTISNCLRGVRVNNGKNGNGSIRKTCYKHNFKKIN